MTRIASNNWIWICRDRQVENPKRTLIMGILNVTPDSFSDGGRYVNTKQAVEHAQQLVEEGADIIDVGGESTRPGAAAVSVEEECERVVPVIEQLANVTSCLISVDTMKAPVARAALAAGAHIVNDVTALTGDSAMIDVVRDTKAGVVLMHMHGNPRTMQQHPTYNAVVADVKAYLSERLCWCMEQGLSPEQVVLDPGIGFGKTLEHNVTLLAQLASFHELGRPLLVGLSRKSFLGALTGCEVQDRLSGSLAGLVCSIGCGTQILRVHDVKESCEAARIADILLRKEHEV